MRALLIEGPYDGLVDRARPGVGDLATAACCGDCRVTHLFDPRIAELVGLRNTPLYLRDPNGPDAELAAIYGARLLVYRYQDLDTELQGLLIADQVKTSLAALAEHFYGAPANRTQIRG